MSKIFYPLLALIASVTDRELAKYVEYLKHENRVLRARLPNQVHTTHEERQTLLKYGKVIRLRSNLLNNLYIPSRCSELSVG